MNRREFLERMFAAGLVVAAPKIIFDLAANTFRKEEWQLVNAVSAIDPCGKIGYFYCDKLQLESDSFLMAHKEAALNALQVHRKYYGKIVSIEGII